MSIKFFKSELRGRSQFTLKVGKWLLGLKPTEHELFLERINNVTVVRLFGWSLVAYGGSQ